MPYQIVKAKDLKEGNKISLKYIDNKYNKIYIIACVGKRKNEKTPKLEGDEITLFLFDRGNERTIKTETLGETPFILLKE